MNVSILYIAIGKYEVLWDEFYQSAKKHLFKSHQVHFYLFTDSARLLSLSYSDVKVISKPNYGWPGNTLYRFHFFKDIESDIKSDDYTFFFNANALFVRDIDNEILPDDYEDLVVATHFKANKQHPLKWPYDRNKKSTAFVEFGSEGRVYAQACFIGAKTEEFIKCTNQLSNNIEIDDKNGVCALWHDESHFNNYIINKRIKILPYSYVYPEVLGLPGEINILMRSKERYANLITLRGEKKGILKLSMKKINNQKYKLWLQYNYLMHKYFKKGNKNEL